MKKCQVIFFFCVLMLAGMLTACARVRLANEPVEHTTPAPSSDQKKICLVWQPKFGKGESIIDREKIDAVSVVSPVWFSIDDGGRLRIHDDAKKAAGKIYVEKAHALGYKVWPLVSNAGFSPEMFHRLLSSQKARKKAVESVLGEAEKYGVDGINLDFENIDLADRDELTAFVEEISSALREKGLVVSMDVTVISDSPNWSLCYDRRSLARSVDYMMLMAYDEHAKNSKTSGSVSSLPWVEKGIAGLLKEVPAEKLVLGIPTYTRLWEEQDGVVQKATTLRMPDAEKLVSDKKIVQKWDSTMGQYYFEYTEGGRKFRVWREDARSIALKTSLANRYDLAGVAIWRLGFETDDVWPLIKSALDAAS